MFQGWLQHMDFNAIHWSLANHFELILHHELIFVSEHTYTRQWLIIDLGIMPFYIIAFSCRFFVQREEM